MEEKNLYNQVTCHNFDSEDFIFRVNSVPYLIKAGETRNFPKFMVVLATKHFVDKILNKQDIEGKLVARPEKRQEVAAKFAIAEEKYEEPQMPTDAQIVDKMNQPTDLDSALQSTKPRTASTPVHLSRQPASDIPTPKQFAKVQKKRVVSDKPEKFDQVEEEKTEIPPRKEMVAYAKNTLKLDVESSEIKKRFKKLSDKELYDELQIGD